MNTTAKRPPLTNVRLDAVWPPRPGLAYCTMSVGQPWDAILQGALDAHFVLLELDDDEQIVAAYRRPKGG